MLLDHRPTIVSQCNFGDSVDCTRVIKITRPLYVDQCVRTSHSIQTWEEVLALIITQYIMILLHAGNKKDLQSYQFWHRC